MVLNFYVWFWCFVILIMLICGSGGIEHVHMVLMLYHYFMCLWWCWTFTYGFDALTVICMILLMREVLSIVMMICGLHDGVIAYMYYLCMVQVICYFCLSRSMWLCFYMWFQMTIKMFRHQNYVCFRSVKTSSHKIKLINVQVSMFKTITSNDLYISSQ